MDRLARVVSWFLAALLIVAVAINFSNVVARYLFDQPFGWAEEALGFLQIGLVLIGAALVTRSNAHLRMDAVEHFMPAGVRRRLEIGALVLTIGVAAVVVAMSARIVTGMLENDTRSIVLELPLGIPYSAFFIGFALIGLFALLRLIASLRRDR